jgi:nicotinamide-nucleotide amidase
MLLVDWERDLPDHFSLAYLPSPGIVKLRITGNGSVRSVLETEMTNLTESLLSLIGENHYGFDETSLEETVGKLLKENHFTVATAESCTGGNIAGLITRIPGSSAWFRGSIIAYANEIKVKYLDITENLLNSHGAVSREVVEMMAQSCLLHLDTDYSVATSGIAGPDGGTISKPVGTVWIAVASRKGITSQCFHFGEHRERNIVRATMAALNMLRTEILKETTHG